MAPHNSPIILATLGDLRRHDYRLTAHCGRCRRQQRLDLDALVARLGADFSYTESHVLLDRLRCTACSARPSQIIVAPNLDHVRGSGAVG